MIEYNKKRLQSFPNLQKNILCTEKNYLTRIQTIHFYIFNSKFQSEWNRIRIDTDSFWLKIWIKLIRVCIGSESFGLKIGVD